MAQACAPYTSAVTCIVMALHGLHAGPSQPSASSTCILHMHICMNHEECAYNQPCLHPQTVMPVLLHGLLRLAQCALVLCCSPPKCRVELRHFVNGILPAALHCIFGCVTCTPSLRRSCIWALTSQTDAGPG